MQILAQDPEQAAPFYSQLFQWEISKHDSLQYRRVNTGQDGLDGGIWPVDANTRNFVQLYVQVPDVPAAIEQAREFGATVVMPHQVLPDGDEMAILVDPAGMSFGLSKARDGGRPRGGRAARRMKPGTAPRVRFPIQPFSRAARTGD